MIAKKASEFNDFRFEGLNWREASNKYLTMNRVNDTKDRIVVRVADSHIITTRYGYALILDDNHVVFLKPWQVSANYFGNEVLLTKEYFNVKTWGDFSDFGNIPENLDYNTWLDAAIDQQKATYKDEYGDDYPATPVKWEK